VLESVQGIAVENLCAEDVVRGELVKRIIQAYEKDEENE
jgi:phosphate starvation-inducible protein PhoH